MILQQTAICSAMTALEGPVEDGGKESQLEAVEAPPLDNRDKMKKNITVLRGIALCVGGIIGTGIFITPNSISR